MEVDAGGIAEGWRVAVKEGRVVLMRRVLVEEVDKLAVVEEDEGRQSAAASAPVVGVDVDPALIILGSNICVCV